VKALKFLLPGAVGPFSGFRWEGGTWHDTSGDPTCGHGVHACEPGDLPFWLQDELWVVELRGDVARGRHKVVGAGGRILGRVEAWDDAARREFASACVARVRELAARRPDAAAHLGDLEQVGPQASAAAIASLAARAAEAVDGTKGYDAERAAQAAWLGERLGLEGLLAR